MCKCKGGSTVFRWAKRQTRADINLPHFSSAHDTGSCNASSVVNTEHLSYIRIDKYTKWRTCILSDPQGELPMEEVAEPFKASGCATGGNALCCMSPCKPTSYAPHIPGATAHVIVHVQGSESAPCYLFRLHSPGSVMT